jgi:co-chaperonin GroES (HSP10)
MRADIALPHTTDLEHFQPIGGQVVVMPADVEQSKLIVTLEHRKHESCRGTVLLVAEGVTEVRPGQEVLFAPYSHRVIELNGNFLFLLHESDMLALVVAAGKTNGESLGS